MGDIADIAVIARQLFRLNHACINAAHADCRAAQLFNQGNQILVGFAGKHHLHDFNGFLIRIPQTIHKSGGDIQTLQHAADFGAAAMHQNDVDADQLQQDNVAHDSFFQQGVNHGVAAVFYNNCFSVVFLDIRQGGC